MGNIGNQFHLHALTSQLFLHGLLYAFLDMGQVFPGLVKIRTGWKGRHSFILPVLHGFNPVHQHSQFIHSLPVVPEIQPDQVKTCRYKGYGKRRGTDPGNCKKERDQHQEYFRHYQGMDTPYQCPLEGLFALVYPIAADKPGNRVVGEEIPFANQQIHQHGIEPPKTENVHNPVYIIRTRATYNPGTECQDQKRNYSLHLKPQLA